MKTFQTLLYFFLLSFLSCKKSDTPAAITPPVKDSVISTFAGTGGFGFSGDGGLATAAVFGLTSPSHVAVDKSGNLYITDTRNIRIRKVSTTGIITTFAGTGSGGFSGDGGPATAAKLDNVEGVATDDNGNVYIAANGRIRKVSAAGIITTVAGGGANSANDGVGGAATAATLSQPAAVCTDAAGNIFIADYGNHRVKKVDKATGIITTIAGNGTQGFTGDGGPAINAGLRYPVGVVADTEGNVFISTDQRIRKVNSNGVISTVAGTGAGSFNAYSGVATAVNIWPVGMAINNIGQLLIADYAQSLIRKVDASGYLTTVAGTGGYNKLLDGGKPWLAGFTYPTGLAVDATGNIFIADYGARRVRKISILK